MKWFAYIVAGYFCFILNGCITEYEAKGLEEMKNILVVEGIITEGETLITLSRSVNLTDNNPSSVSYIDDAFVFVECDDGTLMQADEFAGIRNGQYVIQTGKLDFERQYRLKIEIEDEVYSDDCPVDQFGTVRCPKSIFEYCSDYMNPILTPDIDSIFWTKKDRGQPVNIHVATHSLNNAVLYYRWSYKEDWEIISEIEYDEEFPYPCYCWNKANSRELLIGSAEKTVFGRLTDIVAEINPSEKKLEQLYRITVKQNAISKRAYDYYNNIKKNSQQTGNIFAPVQSELRGNIICITDPNKPVIGYVDISTSTQNQLYIPYEDMAYEFMPRPYDCNDVMQDTLLVWYEGVIPVMYVPHFWGYDDNFRRRLFYIHTNCVDCTNFGTTIKPDDWPNEH